jgi:regulator of protease activity HflC (stomatin/prohibitin superfamily)
MVEAREFAKGSSLMRKTAVLGAALLAGLLGAGVFAFVLGARQQFADVPPTDIAMVLTPTGYEGRIYTPGQVDIGNTDSSGRGNRLVLTQRSGFEIREQFVKGDDEGKDREDHRCLTADKAPMSLDVRLLFALPDYATEDGKADIARLFLLGNPQLANAEPIGRVLRLTAASVYDEQAKLQIRSEIRQICGSFANFDTAFAAFLDQSDKGLTAVIGHLVATMLVEHKVPLRLVSANISNMKPDPTVIDAIAAQQSAQKRVEAIKTITDFLGDDPAGARLLVYKMQTLQEIVAKAGANGHNTIFMTDLAEAAKNPGVVPIH